MNLSFFLILLLYSLKGWGKRPRAVVNFGGFRPCTGDENCFCFVCAMGPGFGPRERVLGTLEAGMMNGGRGQVCTIDTPEKYQ